LEKGDPVTVFGPYGRFSNKFLEAERDCILIGGGVGITPFIGIWHVALHSEERLDKSEVSESLQLLHPEIIRTWRSPRYFKRRHYTEQTQTNDEDVNGS
jgi:Na+-transporting NADH:ubiquinone oxidoreductase subunit NqrF